MPQETFEMFVQRERDRLHGEREAIFNQQHELESKLAAINRELAAIDAYEAAKTGKPAPVRKTRPLRVSPQRARRGSKREELIKLIQYKSGEMSVSNALTALTKSNQVVRREGKYQTA